MDENRADYICGQCRYLDCSMTVWPCSVCIRIHQYKDYFVPIEDAEKEPKGEAK